MKSKIEKDYKIVKLLSPGERIDIDNVSNVKNFGGLVAEVIKQGNLILDGGALRDSSSAIKVMSKAIKANLVEDNCYYTVVYSGTNELIMPVIYKILNNTLEILMDDEYLKLIKRNPKIIK